MGDGIFNYLFLSPLDGCLWQTYAVLNHLVMVVSSANATHNARYMERYFVVI